MQVIYRILWMAPLLFLLAFVHKYYVTISEVNYNEENSSLEISVKFIGHDLEKALEKKGVPELFIGTDKEHQKSDEYLLKYISDYFKISADGKQLKYNFVGKEVGKDDFVWVYLEVKEVDMPNEIKVSSTLMTDIFSTQSNIIHFTIGEKKESITLNKDHSSEKISF